MVGGLRLHGEVRRGTPSLAFDREGASVSGEAPRPCGLWGHQLAHVADRRALPASGRKRHLATCIPHVDLVGAFLPSDHGIVEVVAPPGRDVHEYVHVDPAALFVGLKGPHIDRLEAAEAGMHSELVPEPGVGGEVLLGRHLVAVDRPVGDHDVERAADHVGEGPGRCELLHGLGVETVRDLANVNHGRVFLPVERGYRQEPTKTRTRTHAREGSRAGRKSLVSKDFRTVARFLRF